jgi:hypothetical protein
VRTLSGLGALWLLLAVGSSAAIAADAPSVTVEGRRLSVRLVKVPLAQALDVILERAGAELTLFEAVDGEVTAQFDDVPFEEGLRRLLGSRNYVVVYTPEGSAPPDGWLKVIVSGQAVESGRIAKPWPALAPAASSADTNLMSDVETGGPGRTVAERTAFLERVLATEADASIRSVALKSLHTLNPSSVASIAQAARFDPSVGVRRYALELLVLQAPSNPIVLTTVLAVASSDPDSVNRDQAATFANSLNARP